MRVCTMTLRALGTFVLLFGLGFAAQSTRAQQTFSFPNFNSTTGLQNNGSSAVASNGTANVLRITPAAGELVGSAWYTTPLSLKAGFTTTFTFQFTGQGGSNGHADGIAFVVQGSPAGVQYVDTSLGGSIGYGDDDPDDNPTTGLANSVAIEFDTYQNTWDPDNNHVAIQSCWDGNNSQHHGATCHAGLRSGMNPTIVLNSLAPFNINVNDGAVHTAIITYAPPCANCQNLTVSLDGQQVAATVLDLGNLGLDVNDDAFVGFTASTGGGFENQDVLSWNFSSQTITQPVSTTAPTTFAFSTTNGAELTHTVDFTPPAGQLMYPLQDPGTIQIQSTNTSVDAVTWPEYVVGGPFAPSQLFPIVEDNTNGVGTNGALFVDLCFDPTLTGNAMAAVPSDANCPFVPSGAPSGTPLLGINVVADLVSKPGITPGTTTALAHYEPTAPSTAAWTPSTGSTNSACLTTTGASGGTQPAPPTGCNTFDVQTAISGDQTTSSGRSRGKGTFALTYGVPMLLSTVTVNGTPINQPPANGNPYQPLSGGLWFSKPLNLGFTVNPACIPGQCPVVTPSAANNFFNPAPVAGENFDIVGQVASTPATPTTVPFDTSFARPISFAAQESLSDGQYTLEWSAVDNVGILEQNQNLVQQAFGACPGADPSSQGTQCYITSLFNAPLNVDSTPPIITSPNSGQTYKANQKNVAAAFTCADPTPGAGLASCVNNGPAALDTTPTNGVLTTKTYSVTGKDKAIPPNSITTPITYFVSCNYAAVTLNASSISKTKLPTLIGITASVTDCMTAPQKVVVNFSVSGPIGKNCGMGSQSLFSTPAFTIKSGTANSLTFPFPILKGACAGTYSVITTTTVQGSNQPPDVVTSTLTVTNN